MADVANTLNGWSTTESSNLPLGTTTIGTGLDENLRMIQAVVRQTQDTGTIASATTTDLSTVNAKYITVSGTTTITGLGTLTAGMTKWLIFSGALTLTHNGTSLILPGAANITTVAGDTALMESLGSGNWKCLAYEPTTWTGTGGQVHATSPTLVTPVATTSLTTGSTTFSLINTTATTVNFAGAASTALNIGHASGTNTILGATTFSQALVSTTAVGSSDYMYVNATKRIYLDGIGDTFFAESSANNIRFTTAGQTAVDITSSQGLTVVGALTAASLSTGSGAISGGTGKFTAALGSHQTSAVVVHQADADTSRINAYSSSATVAGKFEILQAATDGSPSFTTAWDASGNVTFPGTLGVTEAITGTVGNFTNDVPLSFTPAANGTYGNGQYLRWYRANGSTVKGYVGFTSNNDITLSIGTVDAAGQIAIRSGNQVDAITINSSQAVTIPGTLGVTGLLTLSANVQLATTGTSSSSTLTWNAAKDTYYFDTANCTVTLPSPATYIGTILNLHVYDAHSVVSASSNIVDMTGSVTTAILAATAGKWATLKADGTYWRIISAN